MRRLHVLYDARCGLCNRARRWLEDQPTLVELVFLPAGSEAAARQFPTLTVEGAEPEELVVIADDGGVYRGGDAWIIVLYATEAHREWSLRLASPALRPLARRAFAWISGNRGWLSRRLGLAGETELVATLGRIADPACPWPDPARNGTHADRPPR